MILITVRAASRENSVRIPVSQQQQATMKKMGSAKRGKTLFAKAGYRVPSKPEDMGGLA